MAIDPDEKLDETIEETFPASDPPANTPQTGIRIGPARNGEPCVRDNPSANRFELEVDGHVAFLKYERKDGEIALIHTEVPPALRGRGLANVLARHALDAAHAEGLRVKAICPVVRAYLRKHTKI